MSVLRFTSWTNSCSYLVKREAVISMCGEIVNAYATSEIYYKTEISKQLQ